MQLTGKLIQLLPMQTGAGKNGAWRKQDVILELDGQYTRKVCVSLWGDKIDAVPLTIGSELVVDFDIESREYNGRWYTDVKAWRVALNSGGNAQAAPAHRDLAASEDLPF